MVQKKGLFPEVHPSIENMDDAVDRLANSLAQHNPDAMREMKKIFWKGTEHWDDLLKERAQINGNLVISEFTKNAIAKFKSKVKS
jgi:methylglutaconyl-CoA hydratase